MVLINYRGPFRDSETAPLLYIANSGGINCRMQNLPLARVGKSHGCMLVFEYDVFELDIYTLSDGGFLESLKVPVFKVRGGGSGGLKSAEDRRNGNCIKCGFQWLPALDNLV